VALRKPESNPPGDSPSHESGANGPLDDCGCSARQEWLNEQIPGLGDAVKVVADPIADAIGYKGRVRKMPELLKPDMKSLVWLAIGTLVVSRFIRL
jgi:hypothetical protein